MGSIADGPRQIYASPEERKAAKYDQPNIQAALEGLHQDGFVVLKDVVDVAHIDSISSYMNLEADDLVKNNSKPFNQGVNCTYYPISFALHSPSLSRSHKGIMRFSLRV